MYQLQLTLFCFKPINWWWWLSIWQTGGAGTGRRPKPEAKIGGYSYWAGTTSPSPPAGNQGWSRDRLRDILATSAGFYCHLKLFLLVHADTSWKHPPRRLPSSGSGMWSGVRVSDSFQFSLGGGLREGNIVSITDISRIGFICCWSLM